MAGFDPKQYRATQAQQFSGSQAPTQAPEPEKFGAAKALLEPFQESGALTTDRKIKSEQSFGRKVGEDALLLGLAPSAAVATGVDFVAHPIDTTMNIVSGFFQGYVDMLDGREWKEHPLLNTVNTVANISVVGAIAKSVVLNGVKSTLVNSARTAGITNGIDAPLMNNVFKEKRFLNNAIKEGEKIGSSEPVVGALAREYEKAGMTKDVAFSTAKDVGTRVFDSYLAENKSKLNTINSVAHPVAALGKSASYVSKPISKAIFGTPEQSAVGKLYGTKIVGQDIPGFAVVEEWASMQLGERGVKNTVDNRVRQIQDWVDSNPEYASLDPIARNKHFAEYAKDDLTRQKFAESKGRDYVLTKAMPKNYIEAIQHYIENAPRYDADGTPITNGKLIDLLEEQYGRDFGVHKQEVRNRMKGMLEENDRGSLLKSVKILGDSRVPVTMRKLTKDESTFVADLEGSGYRIGRSPSKTKISQAADVTGKLFAKENLIASRSVLGRVVDRFGLSPTDIVEGAQFFKFRETFTQKVIKKYGFSKNITIEGSKYPVRSLHQTLETLRQVQQRNASGILPSNYTIADLRYSDLKKMGFSEKDAKIIDKALRESSVTSPAVTGLGEAAANLIRTRDNKLSRAYNSFLRVQSDLRFKKNPMFAMQAAVETVTWGALFNKTVPGTKFVTAMIDRVKGVKTPLKNSLREPSMRHQTLVQENILVNYNRQLRDASAPEIYKGISESKQFEKTGVAGVSEKLSFARQNSDSSIWLGAAGFSNVKITTNLMTTYASKFGMTLDDALSFSVKDGKKVYKNPDMVSRMQDAAQGIFGYQGSGLNSPLIRTLNTVFFPLRFSAKSVVQTSRWMNDLSPASRLAVMNSWVASAQWIATPEGQEWKNKNRGLFASLFNYTFAYEGLGKTVNAVTKGELFGGNTGLIGGLPFGFVVNIAKDLGYIAESEQINTTSGKPFQRKVQKDPTSFPAFVKVVEDIILSMTPAMPFYTASGGDVKVFLNRGVRNFVQDVLSITAAGLDPTKDIEDYKKQIDRSERRVKPEYTRDSFFK